MSPLSVASPFLSLAGAILLYALWKVVPRYIDRYNSSMWDMPGPRSSSWLYGNLGDMRSEEPGVMLERWAKRHGHVLKYKVSMNADALLMLDTKAVNHVLTHSHDYPKPEIARFNLGLILGKGLLVVEGEQHRQQRRILNPAFGPVQIRALTDIFVEKAHQLRNIWHEQVAKAGNVTQLDVVSGLNNMTLDVIGLAGFNYDLHSLNPEGKPNELRLAFDVMFRAISGAGLSVLSVLRNYVPIFRMIPTQVSHRMDDAQRVARRIGMALIAEKKAAILRAAAEAGGEKEIGGKGMHDRDLLTLLIKANMSTDIPESQRLSDEDMLAQVPTFLVAGHETTSTATAWCLFALAQNQSVQTQLREELWGVPTESPTMDELNALPYLEAVVRESMRVYAPVSATIRVSAREDVIPLERPYVDRKGNVCDSVRIPKNTRISIPILAMNKSKDLWGPDAQEFKPERWLSGTIPEAAHAIPGVWGNMLTFLGGPRACIGFRFSLVEMKALLFTLIRSFEFELALPKEEISKIPGLVDRPFLKQEKQKGARLPLKVKTHVRPEY
ncbi:cytochrome P450 [Fomitopsis serialis]|uniref:cytochrome P450 n=1 Tax=Fomitopsis serialis TaxID=139415 RepID=UPI0020088272|nr:cytochrome P450 [Neoantrodia serialis]KAH9930922.1 cytochrome P450 [Neoantrodia serialis]